MTEKEMLRDIWDSLKSTNYNGTVALVEKLMEKQWIGLTDLERFQAEEGAWYMDEFDKTIYALNIENKLKEKNG